MEVLMVFNKQNVNGKYDFLVYLFNVLTKTFLKICENGNLLLIKVINWVNIDFLLKGNTESPHTSFHGRNIWQDCVKKAISLGV